MKILRYKTITGEINEVNINTDEEREILDFQASSSPERQFIFRGTSMKNRNMEVCEKEKWPVYSLANDISKEDIEEFEREYFPKFKKLDDFLLAKGAIRYIDYFGQQKIVICDSIIYNRLSKLWRLAKDRIYNRELKNETPEQNKERMERHEELCGLIRSNLKSIKR